MAPIDQTTGPRFLDKRAPQQISLAIVLLAYQAGTMDVFFQYAYLQIELAEELAKKKVGVTIVSRFSENGECIKNGVRYLFVSDRLPSKLPFYGLSYNVIKILKELAPEIIHIHGFQFPLQVLGIRFFFPKTALIGEYHSDSIWRGGRKWLQKAGLAPFNVLLFTNNEHRAYWIKTMIAPGKKVLFSLEASCRFRFEERARARAITRFKGEPVFIWNSRIIERRDPITVLKGFQCYLKIRPEARFYMMVPDADAILLSKVKKTIASCDFLKKNVRLILGRRPHKEMEVFYNSADYLISGTRDDAYGFGAVDAMSCGVIPIVTDISTFRQITGNGSVGGLWRPGDPEALCLEISKVVDSTFHDITANAKKASTHFKKNLSYSVLTGRLLSIYEKTLMDTCHSM